MTSSNGAPRVLTLRPVGSRAVLAELAGIDEVLALTEALRKSPLPGQDQVVPAAATVLVRAESATAVPRLRTALLELELPQVNHRAAGAEVTIDTVYDGEDLATVARLTGRSAESVVAAHSGQPWTAAFGGFAPGFIYLLGDGSLDVPRLSSPRTAVPPGSVAIAGKFSAVYPGRSPGGWQLLGHTDAVMWDLDRADPALVTPGDSVRFRPVRAGVRLGSRKTSASADNDQASNGLGNGLRVVSSGLLSLIEDLGRPGFEDLGVPASGAVDRASLRRANRLVGNEPGAACIETVAGGLALRAAGDHIVAVTGAPVSLSLHPRLEESPGGRESRSVPVAQAFVLMDGESLHLGAPPAGLRSYVGVRGGIDEKPALGSRSTDTLSGIGPSPLVAGRLLPVGSSTASGVVGFPELQPDFPTAGQDTELRVIPGPRVDWFEGGTLEQLCSQAWSVTPRSNRVGMRLEGDPLRRKRSGEMASEGMAAGALQVPPDGQPVMFLADHPVTGGYPVIAVVAEEDLALAAQVPPGGSVRFRLY